MLSGDEPRGKPNPRPPPDALPRSLVSQYDPNSLKSIAIVGEAHTKVTTKAPSIFRMLYLLVSSSKRISASRSAGTPPTRLGVVPCNQSATWRVELTRHPTDPPP